MLHSIMLRGEYMVKNQNKNLDAYKSGGYYGTISIKDF